MLTSSVLCAGLYIQAANRDGEQTLADLYNYERLHISTEDIDEATSTPDFCK